MQSPPDDSSLTVPVDDGFESISGRRRGSRHSSHTTVIEADVDENDIIDRSTGVFSRGTKTIVFIPLFLNLFVLPLFMGGVRLPAYYAISALAYGTLVLLALLPNAGELWRQTFNRAPVVIIVATLSIFAGYSAFSLWNVENSLLPHPVLGSAGMLPNPSAGWSAVETITNFTANFILFAFAIIVFSKERLTRWIVWLAVLICAIAISHWFYDSGKLFWIFEPDNGFIMNRARWPFVNPNHLGQYCLLLIASSLIAAHHHFEKLENAVLKERDNRLGLIVRRFSEPKVQRYCWNLLMTSVVLTATLVTIFGTLSRGTWLGLSVTIAILFAYVGVTYLRRLAQSSKSHRKSTIAQRYKLFARKIGVFLLLLGTVIATFTFLEGRGSELIQERIVYGLTKSKDDLRWVLYGETKPILMDNLIGGIGLGQWPSVFQRREIPELSGYAPEYLHSDPYQLLVEVGLPVFSLLIISFVTAGIMRLLRPTPVSFWIVQAAISGFLISSCLDFPFRIPAIISLFACTLALWAYEPEKTSNQMRL